MPVTHDVALARAYLLHLTTHPSPEVHAFVAHHGVVDAVRRLRAGLADTAVLRGIRRDVPWELAERDLARADIIGARLLVPEDAGFWPTQVSTRRFISPLALWVRGGADLRLLTRDAIAITGDTDPSDERAAVVDRVVRGVDRWGLRLVTGTQFGVEARAAATALELTDADLMCVLGCGVDVVHPLPHEKLLGEIAERGLIVSMCPLGATATAQRALPRRLLAAALARCLVVIDAEPCDLTMRAARSSAAENYPVFAHVTGQATTTPLVSAGAATPFVNPETVLDRMWNGPSPVS